MKYSERISGISPSVTLAITAKAGKLKDEGKDVVGFGAGEPDFNTPDNIIDKACEAMKEGKTKYTAASGIMPLKKAICAKLKKDNGLDYEPSQIIVSTGAKQCLANAFEALLNPGDEVILQVPYWVSYPELIKISGGVPVFAEGTREDSYKLTPEILRKYTTDKTKAIVLNSPNNPTGTVYSYDELKGIADFAKEHDLFIISDEMYEKLIYGGNKHVSIAAISDDAYARTLTVNGVSKAYAMTGWRIGYAAGPADFIKLMANLQSHTTSNPSSISQYGALEAIEGDQTFVDNMKNVFEKRRDMVLSAVEEIPGLSVIKPEGAFYVMVDVSSLFGKSYKGRKIENAMDFSDLLLGEKLIAVVPGEAFGVPDFIRISYATGEERIKTGMERIAEFIKELE